MTIYEIAYLFYICIITSFITWVTISGIFVLFKSGKYERIKIIAQDENLLRNERYFTYELIDHFIRYNPNIPHRLLNLNIRLDKKGRTERKKNPFRKFTDDEKLDIIKRLGNKTIAEYILYGRNEQPSNYLKNQYNKLKLQIDFKE